VKINVHSSQPIPHTGAADHSAAQLLELIAQSLGAETGQGAEAFGGHGAGVSWLNLLDHQPAAAQDVRLELAAMMLDPQFMEELSTDIAKDLASQRTGPGARAASAPPGAWQRVAERAAQAESLVERLEPEGQRAALVRQSNTEAYFQYLSNQGVNIEPHRATRLKTDETLAVLSTLRRGEESGALPAGAVVDFIQEQLAQPPGGARALRFTSTPDDNAFEPLMYELGCGARGGAMAKAQAQSSRDGILQSFEGDPLRPALLRAFEAGRSGMPMPASPAAVAFGAAAQRAAVGQAAGKGGLPQTTQLDGPAAKRVTKFPRNQGDLLRETNGSYIVTMSPDANRDAVMKLAFAAIKADRGGGARPLPRMEITDQGVDRNGQLHFAIRERATAKA
jgi:hypothetical protein